MNLIMYTAKFETFLFDQIFENRTCSHSLSELDEKHSIEILNRHVRIKKSENKTTNE